MDSKLIKFNHYKLSQVMMAPEFHKSKNKYNKIIKIKMFQELITI